MKEILQKIANILVLNVYNMKEIGLLEGKMGVVLFFYHYGRYSQNKLYLEIADELLDSIFDCLNKTLDISFDQGVAGAAWAIQYLIKNKFVEGNPDEILSDVENLLFEKYVNDSQSKIPISILGMYLQSKMMNELNSEKREMLINIVLKKYDFYFLCLTDKPRPIAYVNSALFVLSELVHDDQYRIWTERIIFKILLHISNAKSLAQVDKCDLNILYKLLSAIKCQMKEKKEVMISIEKICDLDFTTNIPFECLWQYFFYFPKEKISLQLEAVSKYIENKCTFLPNENSLSLFKGLTSIGLNLILQEKENF
ncbi:lanthionine synthetase LanC family protein [Bacteroides sp. 224]|uniref:lanthionine synthetase LanC family protein n=1 Tax=Bacteroides sp. 224 TaxID=2302936 RepID=UPI0013D0AB8B|nr:lanthionine synthetase LanC family protein [Bacteroides sp. 224]NDV64197.1 hypothetical protein [Bacteroides sp. 224]